jgi:hypothetical protein
MIVNNIREESKTNKGQHHKQLCTIGRYNGKREKAENLSNQI